MAPDNEAGAARRPAADDAAWATERLGHEDALTIVLPCASTELDVLAITTVEGGLTRGRTVSDEEGVSGRAPNAEVGVEIDRTRGPGSRRRGGRAVSMSARRTRSRTIVR